MADNLPVNPQSELIKEVAFMTIEGKGQQAIAKALTALHGETITWRKVKRIQESDECKQIVKSVRDVEREEMKALLRHRGSQLANKVVTALEKALDKGNINAVPYVMQLAGIGSEDDGKDKGGVTIVLPPQAAAPQEVIEVKLEKDSADSD